MYHVYLIISAFVLWIQNSKVLFLHCREKKYMFVQEFYILGQGCSRGSSRILFAALKSYTQFLGFSY